MAHKYLGTAFDIHGGGLDLIFPHHENELAQSRAPSATASPTYWVHNAWVTMAGEKMSKSLGNSRAGHRDGASGGARSCSATTWARRTTARRSSTARSRCARRRPAFGRIEGFVQRVAELLGGSVEPAADGAARVRRGDGRRPRRPAGAGRRAHHGPAGQQPH